MRVLQISDFFLPRMGGIERVVLATSRRLVALGFQTEVLTHRSDPAAPEHEVLDGIPVWRIGRRDLPFPMLYRDMRSAATAWARRELDRFDLAHSHQNLIAHTLLGDLQRRSIPLVATFYGPWAEEYRTEMEDPDVPSRWPRQLRRLVAPVVAQLLRRLQRDVVRAARCRVVLSDYSRRDLTRLTNASDDAWLVPGGVDIERFAPRDQAEARRRLGLDQLGAPLLVSVRRLVPRMGLDRLLDAAAPLSRQWPTLAVAIAGVGPLLGPLRDRAERLGLAGRVRLLGSVAEQDLPWLYAAGDVTVVPTRALEGFGLPVLESFAVGRPVIATACGALPETVAQLDPEMLVVDGSLAQLAAAIARVLAMDRSRLAEQARTVAESYSWDVVTDRLVDVYHRALAR